jgi:hypothetical protein
MAMILMAEVVHNNQHLLMGGATMMDNDND